MSAGVGFCWVLLKGDRISIRKLNKIAVYLFVIINIGECWAAFRPCIQILTHSHKQLKYAHTEQHVKPLKFFFKESQLFKKTLADARRGPWCWNFIVLNFTILTSISLSGWNARLRQNPKPGPGPWPSRVSDPDLAYDLGQNQNPELVLALDLVLSVGGYYFTFEFFCQQRCLMFRVVHRRGRG